MTAAAAAAEEAGEGKEELERPYTGREEKRAEGGGRMYANEGEDVEGKKEAGDGGRRTDLSPLPASDVSQTRRPFFSDGDLCPPSRPTWGSSSSLLLCAAFF